MDAGLGEGIGNGDKSNSQFALLALHEAERAGVEVDYRTWALARAYWEDCQNADGSWDVYIGPEKPKGNVNWIQTIPGKGWNLLWRIYGPEQAWYDKKWRPSEIEEVK